MSSTVIITNQSSIAMTMGVQTDVPQAFKYTWKRNGKPMSTPSDPSVTINSPSQDDLAASYSCLVEGLKGKSEESAAVSAHGFITPVAPPPPWSILPAGYAAAILALVKNGSV